MSATTYTEQAFPRPRRPFVPAWVLQWATWLLVVALILGPFIPLAYASLRDRPLYEAGGVFTLDPYRELFSDSAYWHAWANTLAFAALTTAMAVGFGALVAILCARTDLAGRSVFSKLILLPVLLPSLGMVLGWLVVWGPGGYLTNMFSQRLHIPTLAIDTIPGMALVEATRLLPWRSSPARRRSRGPTPRSRMPLVPPARARCASSAASRSRCCGPRSSTPPR